MLRACGEYSYWPSQFGLYSITRASLPSKDYKTINNRPFYLLVDPAALAAMSIAALLEFSLRNKNDEEAKAEKKKGRCIRRKFK